MAEAKTPEDLDELVKSARLSPGSTQGAALTSEPAQSVVRDEQAPSTPSPSLAATRAQPAHDTRTEAVSCGTNGQPRVRLRWNGTVWGSAPAPRSRVLILSSNRAVAGQLEALLGNAGHDVLRLTEEAEAMKVMETDTIGIVIVEAQTSPAEPTSQLDRFTERWPAIPVLMVGTADPAPSGVAAPKPAAELELTSRDESLVQLVERLLREAPKPS